jgi:hypothetical protein
MKLKEILNEAVYALQETLNPALWNEKDQLYDEVKNHLDAIADEFIEYLDIPENSVTDIIVTGSNASYNWTATSDVDLHLIIDYKKLDKDCCDGDFITDCFGAKKTLWNEQHDITIYDHPVELYAQKEGDKLHASGIFSLVTNKWVKKPKRVRIEYDDISVTTKFQELKSEIEQLFDVEADELSAADELKEKIKNMRQSGLEIGGEFSVENLVFKKLRNEGYLERLYSFTRTLKDRNLSL